MANDRIDQAISRRTLLKGAAIGGAAIGVGGVLAACGSSKPTGPIKVGVLTDVTGAFGVVGKSNVETAQFTVDEINAAGGVLGRQLQLVVGDSASGTDTAATVARQLVEKDKVDFVIGTVTSATREAVKGHHLHHREDAAGHPHLVRGRRLHHQHVGCGRRAQPAG